MYIKLYGKKKTWFIHASLNNEHWIDAQSNISNAGMYIKQEERWSFSSQMYFEKDYLITVFSNTFVLFFQG